MFKLRKIKGTLTQFRCVRSHTLHVNVRSWPESPSLKAVASCRADVVVSSHNSILPPPVDGHVTPVMSSHDRASWLHQCMCMWFVALISKEDYMYMYMYIHLNWHLNRRIHAPPLIGLHCCTNNTRTWLGTRVCFCPTPGLCLIELAFLLLVACKHV